MVCALKRLVKTHKVPSRFVLGSDSRVCIGAWVKGRSSSFLLNGILRKTIGWQVLSGHTIHLIWLPTKENPSDDPSRFARLRSPKDPAAWLAPLLIAEPARSYPRRAAPRSAARFVEAYAGNGGLTLAVTRRGLRVCTPLEAYPTKNRYVESSDLDRPEVIASLCDDIRRGLVWFVHFGLPCTSWGRANTLNGGTRRKGFEQGDNTLQRECSGNEQVTKVVNICLLLARHGGFFSIENHFDSYVWDCVAMLNLKSQVHCYMSRFDQCAYELTLPGSCPESSVRKLRMFLATLRRS